MAYRYKLKSWILLALPFVLVYTSKQNERAHVEDFGKTFLTWMLGIATGVALMAML